MTKKGSGPKPSPTRWASWSVNGWIGQPRTASESCSRSALSAGPRGSATAGRSLHCASPQATTKTPTGSRCPVARPEPGRGMWGKRGMLRPSMTAATMFFRPTQNKKRRAGGLGFEQLRNHQGPSRPATRRCWAPGEEWQSKRRSPRPGPSFTSPAFPIFPGTGMRSTPDRGNVGKHGDVSVASDGGDRVFPPKAGPSAPRSSARQGARRQPLRGIALAVAERRSWASGGSRKRIGPGHDRDAHPRIPHIPRDKRLDRAGSGNVGKQGKPAAASGPVLINLRRPSLGSGAQAP